MSERDINIAANLFVLIGVGYLFPFSALTQPIDYWHKLFPDFNVEFPLTFVYMWVNLAALTLIVFSGVEPSFTFRLVGGFLGQFATLVFVPSMYFLNLSEHWDFVGLMIATSFVAIVTAYIDSVVISFAAQYPRKIIESLQFGIGLSTLIGSVYRLFTKAVFPPDAVVASSMLYFYCGAFTVVSGVFAYYILLSLPLSKECVKYGVESRSVAPSMDIEYQPVPSDPHKKSIEMKPTNGHSNGHGNGHGNGEKQSLTHGEASYGSTALVSAEELQEQQPVIDKWKLFVSVFYGEFQVFLVYFTTLTVWPPLVTTIPSYNFPYLNESQWWPLLLMFDLALWDCIGRLVTPYRMGLNSRNLPFWVYARVVLIPLLICSAKGYWFTSDFFSVLFVTVLGFSNGYLGSLGIMFCNESVEEHERGVVGMFTGFFLNCGLVLGATMSLVLEVLVKV